MFNSYILVGQVLARRLGVYVFCDENCVNLRYWYTKTDNISKKYHGLLFKNLNNMTEIQLQEFKLDPDSELRFEVEAKNEKVVLEVIS